MSREAAAFVALTIGSVLVFIGLYSAMGQTDQIAPPAPTQTFYYDAGNLP